MTIVQQIKDIYKDIRADWKDPSNDLMDKIRHTYWIIVPYDYRPKSLWYDLKCFMWYRYTTIRPKTIKGHGWCDRTELLPHVIMAILVDYVENEMVNSGHNHLASDFEECDLFFQNTQEWETAHRNLWKVYCWWKLNANWDPFCELQLEKNESIPEFECINMGEVKENRLYTWNDRYTAHSKYLMYWSQVCKEASNQQLKKNCKIVVQYMDSLWS